MRSITERMEECQEKIQSEKFLSNSGLGNEVGFYIFDYEPKDELQVREAILFMKRHLEKKNSNIKIQIFDLYEIMLGFFEKRGYMEKNFMIEEKKGSFDLYNRMRKALKIATEQDIIVEYIQTHLDEEAIVFITGVGKVFPVLRSHVILNNLQMIVEKKPLVLFYPGTYELNSLKLFDQFQDDNYYRAFRMVER